MSPLERVWLVMTSLIAMLGLVLGCVNFALAQQPPTPAEVSVYAGMMFDARNRCEAQTAKLIAERDELKRQIEELKKHAGAKETK